MIEFYNYIKRNNMDIIELEGLRELYYRILNYTFFYSMLFLMIPFF